MDHYGWRQNCQSGEMPSLRRWSIDLTTFYFFSSCSKCRTGCLRSDFPNNLPVLQPKESDAFCYSFILTTVCQALTTCLQAEGSCHGRNHITDFGKNPIFTLFNEDGLNDYVDNVMCSFSVVLPDFGILMCTISAQAMSRQTA